MATDRDDSDCSLSPMPPLISSEIRDLVNPDLCRIFTLEEMKQATLNFNKNRLIGVGGFGMVYRGVIDGDGGRASEAAVKRASHHDKQHLVKFRTEIALLSKQRHRHIVSLIGFCNQESEMVIVCDLRANGDLAQHVYNCKSQFRPLLPWKRRLEICIGVARGLHYLHAEATGHVIIHQGVMSSHILLDSNWDAKIADFGLSRLDSTEEDDSVHTTVKEDLGYVDPDYIRLGKTSQKSDEYLFGVVLLEILCARPAFDILLGKNQTLLAERVLHRYQNGKLEEMIDPHLKGKISPKCLKMFVETATMCLADRWIDRPTMGDVMQDLEFALYLQESADVPLGRSSTLAQDKPKAAGVGRVKFLPPCGHFSLEQVNIATDNFHEDRCIAGGLSKIYKGDIRGVDAEVAIKLTTAQSVFQTEIMILVGN